jgi:Mitochondrial K+-H+ exchange-related
VKVYLLLVNDEEYFFYSDDSEVDESEDTAPITPSGIQARLRERWHELQRSIREADAGTARWVRRTWNWLHSRVHRDEGMLARLRSARLIELHHPSSRDEGTVNAIWRTYLGQRYRRHLLYALVNFTIAVPTILFLWPLPGPNIIGYWFVYRMIHHLVIVRGISRVKRGSTPTILHSMMSLNLPVLVGVDGTLNHIAIEPGVKAPR